MSYPKRGEPFFSSATQRKQYGYVKHRAMNKTTQAASLAPILTAMTFLGLPLKHRSSCNFFPFQKILSSVRPFFPFLPCIQRDRDI